MAIQISADVLVQEIRDRHELATQYAGQALENAIRIGELLTEAKSGLRHGQWIPWIEENLPFDVRQAQNYMRVFNKRGELNTKSTSHLTEAVSLLAEPKKEHVKTTYKEIDDEPEIIEAELEQERHHAAKTAVILQSATLFDEWDKKLRELNAEILESIKNNPVSAWIYRPFYVQAMNKLRELLKSARPVCSCPDCRGSMESCETCRGTGYLCKSEAERTE